jgi:16S rRNA (cytosine967-C5)-methyltransferase
VAYDTVRTVHAADGYANLVLSDLLTERRLTPRDAAFATELTYGTLKREGTYDKILVRASGRRLDTLQPAVVDVLRLGAHQLLAMRVPTHAAVGATVELAAGAIGERVAGVVNAVLRKVAQRDMEGWLDELAGPARGVELVALRNHHPVWIARAFSELLGDETEAALEADNASPRTTLVVRPGLYERAELVAAGAEPTPYSPYGAVWDGNPTELAAVRDGRVGVQDEGSQLVALALSRAEAPVGPWLDLCAGPGGKAALLVGLAASSGVGVLAAERLPHRAKLVASALRAYPRGRRWVVAADGLRPAWREGAFARALADVPCTGLGALRRRPEARWRRLERDLERSRAPAARAPADGSGLGDARRRRGVRHVLAAPRGDRRSRGGCPRRRRRRGRRRPVAAPGGAERGARSVHPALAPPPRHGRDVLRDIAQETVRRRLDRVSP